MSTAQASVDIVRGVVDEATAAGEFTSGSLSAVPGLPDVYRQIYVGLDLPEGSGPVIGITSAISGEGRTTVALGMARTLVDDLDTPVVLVEADLFRPSLASLLGVSATRGLPRALRGEASLEEVTQRVSEKLFVVTSDVAGADGARLLHRLAERDPFRGFRARGAVTIMDLPPLLEHGYSALAASIADAIILVIRAGATPAEMVHEAIERLKDTSLQGAVLNGQQAARLTWPWRLR